MSEDKVDYKTEDVHSIQNVRSKTTFINFIEEEWKEPSIGTVKICKVSEDIWNRIYSLISREKLDGCAKLISCGDVSMEIGHSYGVLIVINEDYK